VGLTKKQLFILLGAGLVASGIVTIAVIYQGLSNGDMFVYQPMTTSETAGENREFNLQEIHSVPLAKHDHVSLSILVNGQPMEIPEGVGMNPELWHDHSLDRYGPSGISPMHTHDTTGTIHIESTTQREFTVGEFLSVMGIEPGTVTKMTVDGNEATDFLDHEMKRGEKIQLEATSAGQ
jgi:hypothetical protein